MFNYDSLIKTALENPEQVWVELDSFWADRTDADTEDLVHYQAWASTLLFLNVHAKSRHFLATQTVPVIEEFLRQPWFPFVLFEDRLVDQSLIEYGDAYQYSPVPQITYGQQTGISRYIYPLPQELLFVYDIPQFVDKVTDTSVVIDHTQFTYTPSTGNIEFTVDPFTLITPKVAADSGRNYIVLWMRNPQLDLNVAFDQVGWNVKFDRRSQGNYAEGLQKIWDLVLRGPSIQKYKTGLMDALGFPYAAADGTIRRLDDDTYQWVISTDTEAYTVVKTKASPIVVEGTSVVAGQELTDGVKFFEYQDALTATSAEIPGLLLRIPLSTGTIAELSFANIAVAWEFSAGRPSEWRFPIGGDAADIEQFWIDVDTYATANSIDFATIYSLPAAVNPMTRILQDLVHTNLFVASVALNSISVDPGGFADRARLLLPLGAYIVLQQSLGAATDSYDLSVTTSETVGYGYNAAVPTETISVSGTDLVYTDYTPLVVTA